MEEFLELVIKNVEIMTQHIVKVTFVRPVRPNFKSLLRFLIQFLQRQYVVMLFYSLGVGNSALFHNQVTTIGLPIFQLSNILKFNLSSL